MAAWFLELWEGLAGITCLNNPKNWGNGLIKCDDLAIVTLLYLKRYLNRKRKLKPTGATYPLWSIFLQYHFVDKYPEFCIIIQNVYFSRQKAERIFWSPQNYTYFLNFI